MKKQNILINLGILGVSTGYTKINRSMIGKSNYNKYYFKILSKKRFNSLKTFLSW